MYHVSKNKRRERHLFFAHMVTRKSEGAQRRFCEAEGFSSVAPEGIEKIRRRAGI